MSRLEIVAALTGLASVVYVVKNNIWTWFWGIVSGILYTVVLYQSKAYANAGLNLFCFVPLSAYAWWVWLRGGPKQRDDLPVTVLSRRAQIGWLGTTVLLSVLLVWINIALYPRLHLAPDPNPYADGITTAISIVAQYLQARKWMENWPLWIVAHTIYTFYLWPSQRLWPTTILYAMFLVLAILGWIEWRKILAGQTSETPTTPGIHESAHGV